MKRTRKEPPPPSAALGVTELSSLLGSDDAHTILQGLRRFVDTVRSERQLALGLATTEEEEEEAVEEDEASEEGDKGEEGGENEPKQKKKRRKKGNDDDDDAWKQDTAHYNVPFVGTSVSVVAKDKGTVVKDTWPCGLLLAVLEKSPLAMELTGPHLALGGTVHKRLAQSHHDKLATSLVKHYLKALTEVVTAAIPVSRLRHEGMEDNDNDENTTAQQQPAKHTALISHIVTQRLGDLLQLLSEETGYGKGLEKGGKCGPLAALVLDVLVHLSRVSLITAKFLARSLEHQPKQEAVFRFLLQPARGENAPSWSRVQEHARAKLVQLTMTLLSYADPVVVNILVAGSSSHRGAGKYSPKERSSKQRHISVSNAGLLHLFCKFGLPDLHKQIQTAEDWKERAELSLRLSHLLEWMKTELLLRSGRRRPLFASRVLKGLIGGRDFLMTLVHLCSLVRFPDDTAELQNQKAREPELQCDDPQIEAAQRIAKASQNFVFVLLANPQQSPLLDAVQKEREQNQQHPTAGDPDDENTADGNITKKSHNATQLLVARMLHGLVEGAAANKALVPAQNFVLHCCNRTPALLGIFWGGMTALDGTTSSFALLQQLAWASKLMQRGPSIAECVALDKVSGATDEEVIMGALCPPFVKKQFLAKLLKPSLASPLIMAEVLRLYVFVLQRLEGWIEDKGKQEIVDTFMAQNRMPDLHSVIVVFQTFGRCQSTSDGGTKANPILFGRAADLLGLGARVIPRWLIDAKIDWLKVVVPSSHEDLLCHSLMVQCKFLSTLHAILAIQNQDLSLYARAAPLLRYALRAKPAPFAKTRQILIFLLAERDVASGCSLEVLRHEGSCWVDGMREECIGKFAAAIQESASTMMGIRGWVNCAKLWQEKNVSMSSVPPASSVLLHVFQNLENASNAFRGLACQVAGRSLMYQVQDPRPLASVVASGLKNFLSDPDRSKSAYALEHCLRDFAEAVLERSKARTSCLSKLVSVLFAKQSRLSAILNHDKDSMEPKQRHMSLSSDDCVAGSRYLAQCLLLSDQHSTLSLESHFRLFRRLVGTTFQKQHKIVGELVCQDHVLTRSSEKTAALLFALQCLDASFSADSGEEDEILANFNYRLATDGARTALLLWYTNAPVSSSKSLHRRLLWLLKLHSENNKVENKVIAPCLSRHVDCFVDTFESANEQESFHLVDYLFGTWAGWCRGTVANQHLGVVASVQRALGRMLESKVWPFVSYRVRSLFQSLTPEQAMLRSLEVEQHAPSRQSESSLPQLLIVQDYIAYSHAYVMALVSPEDDKRGPNAQRARLFGKALPVALELIEDGAVSGDIKQKAASLVVEAAEKSLELSDGLTSTHLLDSVRCFRPSTLALCPSELLKSLARRLVLALELKAEGLAEAQNAAVHLCSIWDAAEEKDETAVELEWAALSSLCSSMERQLRHTKNDFSSLTLSEEVSNKLELFRTLWTNASVKHEIADHSRRTVLLFVRTLLKHGLGVKKPSVVLPVQMKCLEVVLATAASAGLVAGDELGASHNSLVFRWITSHSNFPDILQQDSLFEAKLLLMRILLSCISEDTVDIPFQPETWSSVLAGYGASLSPTDRLSRQFLFRYRKLAPPKTSACFMDQLRWGRTFTAESGWEWLPSWIVPGRIQATLRRFPFDDSLDNTNSGPSFDISNSAGDDKSSPNEHQSYSPAFLLPLILAAIEDCGVRDKEHYHEVKQERAMMLEKLSKRGAVALAVASLCCSCSDMRRVALSILGHANRLIQTVEAQILLTWRERPQIACALSSLRRGLVREIAGRVGSAASFHDRPMSVPRISPLCSIFVAKALIILANPGDTVYPSMNRYFLRLEAEHGAIQDLHRLPAFVSLFCSSSLMDDTAAAERGWAVETLRDSFVNEICFGPTMACHALELMMTRIESMASDTGNGVEFEVTVSAISKVVEFVGARGLSHLFVRLGLLSWLSSLIVGRHVLRHGHRHQGFAVLNLLSLAVTRSQGVLSKQETEVSMCGVVQVAAESTLGWINQAANIETKWNGLMPFRNLLIVCRDCFEADGRGTIKADTAAALLEGFGSCCPSSRDQEANLRLVCCLTLQVDERNPPDVLDFCCSAMVALLGINNPTRNTCLEVVACVNRVAKEHQVALKANDRLQKLIQLIGPRCCRDNESRLEWQHLAPALPTGRGKIEVDIPP